jgi:hypothetical protein
MADLGIIVPGTFLSGSSSDTAITGTEPALQAIASADDNKNVHDAANTTHTGLAIFELDDVPADFGGMDTLSVRLRYGLGSALSNNTWDTLTARAVDSGGTALTDEVTLASDITTTTPTNSSVVGFALTASGQSADKAAWDGARLEIRFGITKNKGGDSAEERVFAGELTGTYTAGASIVQGAAILAGGGDAAAASLVLQKAAAVLPGSAGLIGTALVAQKAAVVLAGAASLAGSALVRVKATAVMAGSGALAAVGQIASEIVQGAAVLAAAAGLSAAARVLQQSSVSLAGGGSLAGAAFVVQKGAGALAGSGSLVASGSVPGGGGSSPSKRCRALIANMGTLMTR